MKTFLYLIPNDGRRLQDIAAARQLLEENYGAESFGNYGGMLQLGIVVATDHEIQVEDIEFLGLETMSPDISRGEILESINALIERPLAHEARLCEDI